MYNCPLVFYTVYIDIIILTVHVFRKFTSCYIVEFLKSDQHSGEVPLAIHQIHGLENLHMYMYIQYNTCTEWDAIL